MPKISERNPRYRSKEQICRDLSLILKSDLTHGTKVAVINEILWVWSEFNGKYVGCPWWSHEALKSFDGDVCGYIHEHIVPKRIVRNTLLQMAQSSAEEIHEYLKKYCIGVVVTKGEDQRLNAAGLNHEMPKNWNGDNVWARHDQVGIKRVRVDKNLKPLNG